MKPSLHGAMVLLIRTDENSTYRIRNNTVYSLLAFFILVTSHVSNWFFI